MKNFITLLLFIIFLFILNIVFFYSSPAYQDFLRDLKGVETPTKNVQLSGSGVERDDSFEKKKAEILAQQQKKREEEAEVKRLQNENIKVIQTGKKLNEQIFNDTEGNTALREDIVLGKNYQEVLAAFSKYNLEPLKVNTTLFEITREYPDKYLEYYSKDLQFYFFPTKDYIGVKDIFDVLQADLPISLNTTTQLGDKAFFINLDSKYEDNNARLVIQKNGIVFGLMFDKKLYGDIKTSINNM